MCVYNVHILPWFVVSVIFSAIAVN